MTRVIDTLLDVASGYDAIVFDQWGVLHNGSTPYSGAVDCLRTLHRKGHRMAVLSNSGKRSTPNAGRIQAMGFDAGLFEYVMTSGEALWTEIAAGQIRETVFFAVERSVGDATSWAQGLDISLCNNIDGADAILLMGLRDGSQIEAWKGILDTALSKDLPVFCTNPDRSSPRADGLVLSPGALAFAYKDMGGRVRFYGKPHLPVFETLQDVLGSKQLLMVGDSLEHDIAGAQSAGWDSLLIEGGLYADAFETGDAETTLAALVAEKKTRAPTFRMRQIR
tara:strand:- start:2795 stop:3631 length:837 start_codon:yes stop_codon:yes gene_type:complete